MVNANSILTADADVTLLGMSSKLTVVGAGVVTPADLHAAGTAMDIGGYCARGGKWINVACRSRYCAFWRLSRY